MDVISDLPAGPVEPPSVAADHLPDPLVVKAQEWAELGTERYKDYWVSLTAGQQNRIGKERHEKFKAIAAKVKV